VSRVLTALRKKTTLFHHRDRAQDLAEYCLVVALIALIALGIIVHVSGGIQGIWNTANNTMANSPTATGAGGEAADRH
jgi:Flp pilus assembly pilin Flp